MKTILNRATQRRYANLSKLYDDLNLMLRNAKFFNDPRSQVYQDASYLEALLETNLPGLTAVFNELIEEATSAKEAKQEQDALKRKNPPNLSKRTPRKRTYSGAMDGEDEGLAATTRTDPVEAVPVEAPTLRAKRARDSVDSAQPNAEATTVDSGKSGPTSEDVDLAVDRSTKRARSGLELPLEVPALSPGGSATKRGRRKMAVTQESDTPEPDALSTPSQATTEVRDQAATRQSGRKKLSLRLKDTVQGSASKQAEILAPVDQPTLKQTVASPSQRRRTSVGQDTVVSSFEQSVMAALGSKGRSGYRSSYGVPAASASSSRSSLRSSPRPNSSSGGRKSPRSRK